MNLILATCFACRFMWRFSDVCATWKFTSFKTQKKTRCKHASVAYKSSLDTCSTLVGVWPTLSIGPPHKQTTKCLTPAHTVRWSLLKAWLFADKILPQRICIYLRNSASRMMIAGHCSAMALQAILQILRRSAKSQCLCMRVLHASNLFDPLLRSNKAVCLDYVLI